LRSTTVRRFRLKTAPSTDMKVFVVVTKTQVPERVCFGVTDSRAVNTLCPRDGVDQLISSPADHAQLLTTGWLDLDDVGAQLCDRSPQYGPL
jgi:hypothetical protein